MRYSSKHTFSYRSVFWRHKTLKKRQFKKSKYFQFQKLKTPSHYKTDFKNKNHANKYNYFSAETDGALSGFSLRQPFWPFFKWNSSFLAFLTIADSFVYGYNCLWGLSSNYCGDSYSAWYKCFMPHISIQFFRLPTLFKSLSIYPVAAGETTHWGGGFLEKKKLPINFLGNVPPLDVSHWYVLKKKINKHGFVARDMVLNYGFKNFILENKMFYPLLDNIKVFKNFIFSLQADTGVISTLEYGAIYRLAQSLSSLLSSNTSPHKATKLGLLPTFKYFIFTYLRSYRRVVSGFTINRKHLTHKVYRQARKSKKKTRFLVRTLKRCFYYLFRALRKKKKTV